MIIVVHIICHLKIAGPNLIQLEDVLSEISPSWFNPANRGFVRLPGREYRQWLIHSREPRKKQVRSEECDWQQERERKRWSGWVNGCVDGLDYHICNMFREAITWVQAVLLIHVRLTLSRFILASFCNGPRAEWPRLSWYLTQTASHSQSRSWINWNKPEKLNQRAYLSGSGSVKKTPTWSHG